MNGLGGLGGLGGLDGLSRLNNSYTPDFVKTTETTGIVKTTETTGIVKTTETTETVETDDNIPIIENQVNIFYIHIAYPAQLTAMLMSYLEDNPNCVLWVVSNTYNSESVGEKHPRMHYTTLNAYSHDCFDRNGMGIYCLLMNLKAQRIIPNLIIAYINAGASAYLRRVYPEVPIIGYYEWTTTDVEVREHAGINYRIGNMAGAVAAIHDTINAVNNCVISVTPTYTQKGSCPLECRHRVIVQHEGISVDRFRPRHLAWRRAIPQKIVLYATEGLEKKRCFMEFIHALKILLQLDSNIIVIIVGRDCTRYTNVPQPSYKRIAMEYLGDDISRVMFLGYIRQSSLIKLFQLCDLRVYFTRHFVLSWSMLEGMACGALTFVNDTPAIAEYAIHGKNCIVATDINSPQITADEMYNALRLSQLNGMRDNLTTSARNMVIQRANQSDGTKFWKNIIKQCLCISSANA